MYIIQKMRGARRARFSQDPTRSAVSVNSCNFTLSHSHIPHERAPTSTGCPVHVLAQSNACKGQDLNAKKLAGYWGRGTKLA